MIKMSKFWGLSDEDLRGLGIEVMSEEEFVKNRDYDSCVIVANMLKDYVGIINDVTFKSLKRKSGIRFVGHIASVRELKEFLYIPFEYQNLGTVNCILKNYTKELVLDKEPSSTRLRLIVREVL